MSECHSENSYDVPFNFLGGGDSPVVDLTGYIDCGDFVAAGGSGTIYKGKWREEVVPMSVSGLLPNVVVKVMNIPTLTDEKEKKRRFKRMKREVELWKRIRHDRILPLLGIVLADEDANRPALVSPWMENGNISEFLKRNPEFPVVPLLQNIIEGVHYLHNYDPEIVHGDIKAANVLITGRMEACLCDFGLSRFAEDNFTLWRTTATHANGTLRWMAPELLDGDVRAPTKASDIYAYAMTCYEIFSRNVPFNSVSNEPAVILRVLRRERPEYIMSCPIEIWNIITRCWAQEPNDRPPVGEVLELVKNIDGKFDAARRELDARVNDGFLFPTKEERSTLKRVPDVIPWNAVLIAIVELAERLSFYGSSVVYINFVQHSVGLTTFYQFWCYVTPLLGAYIADTYLGRFKTVCIAVLIALAGHIILVISAIPGVIHSTAAFIIGIIVTGFGTGLFKSSITPLVAEQYMRTKLFIRVDKNGQRVIVDPSLTVSRIYMYFYLFINIGALVGVICMFFAEMFVDFWLPYTISTAIFTFCLIILFLGRNRYIYSPPTGSVLSAAFRVFFLAAKGKWCLNPVQLWRNFTTPDFWDNAKPSRQMDDF